MAYRIEFSEDAERHADSLTARERAVLLDAIEDQLTHQPTEPTRRRKHLRPNPLSTWELRVGGFRVFYNVDEDQKVVFLLAVGVKEHNRLFIEGKEFTL